MSRLQITSWDVFPLMARTRSTVLLPLLLVVAAGCELDIFGPDTPQARSRVSGTVTDAVDGSPIRGVRVYPTNTTLAVSSNGNRPEVDTTTTNESGQYTLDSEHFCPSALMFSADGYEKDGSYRLGCPEPAGAVVDVALTPLPPDAQ